MTPRIIGGLNTFSPPSAIPVTRRNVLKLHRCSSLSLNGFGLAAGERFLFVSSGEDFFRADTRSAAGFCVWEIRTM